MARGHILTLSGTHTGTHFGGNFITKPEKNQSLAAMKSVLAEENWYNNIITSNSVRTTCESIEFTSGKPSSHSEELFVLCSHVSPSACRSSVQALTEADSFEIKDGPSWSDLAEVLLFCNGSVQMLQLVYDSSSSLVHAQAGVGAAIAISISVAVLMVIGVLVFATCFIRKNIDINACDREVEELAAEEEIFVEQTDVFTANVERYAREMAQLKKSESSDAVTVQDNDLESGSSDWSRA